MEEVMEIRLDEAKVAATAKHLAGVCQGLGMNLKADAEESLFLAQELEHMMAREIETIYPERRARKFIPIGTSIPAGAQTYAYKVYDHRGAAKIIADWATDLPMFNALARKEIAQIVELGGAFGYSIAELEAAAMAGTPLEVREQQAAVKGFEKAENDILFFGSAANNIMGFLNADSANGGNVPTLSLPSDGTGASRLWSTKTAELIIRDLDQLVETAIQQSKGAFEINTILLPRSRWGVINTKPVSIGGGSDKTIKSWWMANHPGIEIDWLYELETAGANDTARAMAYFRSPEVVEGQIPLQYQQRPAQPKGLGIIIPCRSRIGGCSWTQPLGALYADGI
jgi:hypothetical protein